MTRWRFWLSMLFLLYVAASVVAWVRILGEEAKYNAKVEAAGGNNEQFLAAYNTGRNGDIITIVGRVSTLPATRDPGAFAWVDIAGTDKTVALVGARAPLCDRDYAAASGSYRYSAEGGVLTVSDPRNVARKFSGIPFRLDRLILLIDPYWCGFPGTPFNY